MFEYKFTAPAKKTNELWQEKTVHVLSGGFNIKNFDAFAVLGYLPKGIPLSLNFDTREATPIKGAIVYEAAGSGATAIKVKKQTPGLLFVAGDIIGNATQTTTVASVDKSNVAYDVINLNAAIGALSVDSALLSGSEVGVGKILKATGLSYADVTYKTGKTGVDCIIQAYEVKNKFLPYPLTTTQISEITSRFFVIV